MEFKDRKIERAELKNVLDTKNFEFSIIYGRRRVGKTELALNVSKTKNTFYYFCFTEKNLDRFYEQALKFDSNISSLKKDFIVLIDYLKDKIDVLIIDEFQNLIKENPDNLNLFQYLVDNTLKNSKMKLIILGSSISMINSKVLSYQSPLYGRKTHSLKLNPVSFFDLKEFFPKLNFNQLMEIYGFADGIPYYLIKVNSDFWTFLKKELKFSRFLKDEVDFLMKYEFEDVSMYKLILEAIANSKTKLSEIKDYIGSSRTNLTPYLKNLIEIDLVKREVPITENLKSRRGRYFLKDNFLKFWFKYIYPNQSSIEGKFFDLNIIKKNYSNYLGFIFEDVCMDYMIRSKRFSFKKIGKYWNKEDEIDVVALGERNYFAECKWKNSINPLGILKSLDLKVSKTGLRPSEYLIFAKSFSKKVDVFNKVPVRCIDIDEMV